MYYVTRRDIYVTVFLSLRGINASFFLIRLCRKKWEKFSQKDGYFISQFISF